MKKTGFGISQWAVTLIATLGLLLLGGCGSDKGGESPGHEEQQQQQGGGSEFQRSVGDSCFTQVTFAARQGTSDTQISGAHYSVGATMGAGASTPRSVRRSSSWSGSGAPSIPVDCDYWVGLFSFNLPSKEIDGVKKSVWPRIEFVETLRTDEFPLTLEEARARERIPLKNVSSGLRVSFWEPVEGHAGTYMSLGQEQRFPAVFKCSGPFELERRVAADKLTTNPADLQNYVGRAYFPHFDGTCEFVVQKAEIKLPDGKVGTISFAGEGKVSNDPDGKKQFSIVVNRIEIH